jgi:N-acetylmuramoyl-L-alanine amidase
MPSVLVEAAFLSNHREEARLVTHDFQQNTALAISQAVRNYGVALELLAQR